MLLKMALRELLRSWRFGLFFIFNLSLGLTGFVALEAFKTAIQSNIESNAKAILSADLAVTSRRPITQTEIQKIREVVGDRPETVTFEFFAMMSAHGQSRLVMVKAIDQNYPFYGDIELGSGQKITQSSKKAILDSESVWIYQELQSQMGLKVGDDVQLGQLRLQVQDTVAKDGTQTFRMASLAPRIFLNRALLEKSGLIQYGSTYSTNYLYKLPQDADLEKIKNQLYEHLPDPAVQVDTPQSAGEDSGRQLAYLSDYLGLVAIIALFMSVLGASYIYRLYLSQKMKEIAIFRTLGLQSGSATGVYVIQVLLLGLFAGLPTLLMTLGVLPLLSALLERFTPFDLQVQLSAKAFGISFLMAILSSFLVCFPFLLKIRDLKPAKLFSEEKFSADISIRHVWSFLPAVLVFWLLSVYQAHSWLVGSAFILVLALTLSLLTGLAWLGMVAITRVRLTGTWFVKFSLLGLRRRKAASFAIFIAVGLGSLLMNILPQLKTTLQAEFQMGESSKMPSLFMFDIQDEQIHEITAFIQEKGLKTVLISPMVRARILKVNDQDYERQIDNINFQTREQEREARFRNRGVNLSYREHLSESEVLLEGRPFSGVFDPSKNSRAQLSLEYRYAERMGIRLGDVLLFDVQGVELEGEVINFRKVKWTSFQPNFFILFQEGVLNEAPKTYISALPGMPADVKSDIQNQMSQKFPNVSIIDVARTVEEVLGVATRMSWSLELMAALALLTGYIVLFSITRAQLRQRRWELNMLKILGSSSKHMVGFILVESFAMTFLSSLAGAALSLGVSAALSFYIFEAPFIFDLFWPAISVISITVVSLGVALLAGMDIIREKPLEILRNEK